MIRSLQIFRDVIATQSFTEAARRNFLTQSAVSHHLKALEAKFGHRLVERGRRQIHLTRAGKLVYAASVDLVKRYERLETALKQPATAVGGKLRVGSIYTIGLYHLPPYTSSFLKRYPQVDLLLSYLKDQEVYEAVLNDRVEIGLVDYPKPHPRLAIAPFKKERIALIVPPRHRWAGKKRISLKDLSGQPFIVPQAELPLEKVLRQARIRVNVVHAFDNIEITKRAVEIGLGLALVPRVTVDREADTGRLKILDFVEGPFERPLGILTRKHAELSPAAEKFIATLQPA